MSTKSKWIAALATGALVTTGVAYAAAPPKDSRGTIVKVIDGDTVDMRIAGEMTRVRLLNIDTPETVHPNMEVECLGPEASNYLKSLLSPGDKVKLEYDIERTDRYGRTLAGVYKDDSLVNADIAAAGLGIAVKYEPNTRFYPEVLAAEQGAHGNAFGLFNAETECTLPAQFTEALEELEQVPEALSGDIAEAGSLAGQAAAAIAVGVGLKSALEAITPDTHPVTHALLVGRYAPSVTTLNESIAHAERTEKAHKDQQAKLVKAEEERLEAERKRKEEEERTKREAEARKKEEQRQAAIAEQNRIQQQKTQQPRKSTQPAPRKTTPKKSTPKSTPKKNNSKYTGPRCYAPGGKSWKPC
ncbi:thermonuclease family protein [Glutamicibacter sp. MNS18]|uniref:thermonuclease family protein n=1 Tax=Glutamicibacter sp. MNS18 TaxID=2989817 RepID=UPI0022364B34|nr:thermonuclease family protein [Glutamicibacter sp. MNS18]MCW4466230.1 thermonuclease family protein [Glutamicibacter sp. MNS18]